MPFVGIKESPVLIVSVFIAFGDPQMITCRDRPWGPPEGPVPSCSSCSSPVGNSAVPLLPASRGPQDAMYLTGKAHGAREPETRPPGGKVWGGF